MAVVVGVDVVGPVVVEAGPPIRAEAPSTAVFHRVGRVPVAQS